MGDRRGDIEERFEANLGYDLSDFTEVGTSSYRTSGEEVLDQPRSDVVSHFFQLLVDLLVVFIVLDELDDQSTVGLIRSEYTISGG